MFRSFREHTAHPGVFAIAVVTLALGIAGATTMFGTLSGVGVGVAAVADQERVGRVFAANPSSGTMRGAVSVDEFLIIQGAAPAFTELAAFTGDSMLLREAAGEIAVEALRVSRTFFRALGFRLAAGRVFGADEFRPGASSVAIVSERFCRARWGAPANAIGKQVKLSGADHVVVGVVADSSWFPARGTGLWVPLSITAEAGDDGANVYLVGRLAANETWARARAQLGAAGQRLAERRPDSRRGWTVSVIPLSEDSMKRAGFGLFGLLGPAIVVLLIASGNVANLLLARGTRRERETAVRAALGASRFRLMRERIAESAWIAGPAGVLGVVLARWGIDGARAWIDRFKPGVADGVLLSPRALAFAVGVTACTPLIVGLVPALLTTRRPVTEALHESSRHRRARTGPYGGRDLLLIVEMALAVVLVLTAGLFAAFMWEINHIERRFDSSHVLSARLELPRATPADARERDAAFLDAVLSSVRAVPGVRTAALSQVPLPISERQVATVVEGCQAGRAPSTLATTSVGPRYFDALGLRVRGGRAIDERDRGGAPAVAVVSEWLARRCWPDGAALGRRLRLGSSKEWTIVVGVAPDAMTNEALGATLPRPPVYLAAAQQPVRTTTLLVRTGGDPAAMLGPVRNAVRSVDRNQPLVELGTLDTLLSTKFAEAWLVVGLMEAFAGLALVLAAVGVFSVTSYSVVERTREFGVRIAIGASSGDILALVLRRALTAIGLGTLAAAVLTLAATRVMWADLITVGAHSPVGFVAIALVLSSVTIAACLLPAHRATRVDPLVALRTD